MTLAELVDQCLLVGFEEPDPPQWIVDGRFGGIVLYGQNLRVDGDVARLAAALDGRLVAVDEEGGDVTRLHYRSGSTSPGNYALGAADDVAVTSLVASGIGAELAAAGVGWTLAPVVDVNSAPDNPVIGVRSFGADPALVARHAAAWVDAVQSHGVAACAKHFPGHGDTVVDSHASLPTVSRSEASWRAVDLPPFVAAIEAGVRAVMSAHVLVPALDDVPATLSRRLLTGVLRGELGFDGVIVTDALDMGAIAGGVGVGAGAVLALAAGADALCLGSAGGYAQYRTARDAVVSAVDAGDLPLRRVEEAAERVARLAAWVAGGRVEVAGVSRGSDTPTTSTPELTAARRALVVHDVRKLHAVPVVLHLRRPANPAVGRAPWNLTDFLEAHEASDVDAAIAAAAGTRPLVVVARDVVRDETQWAAWQSVRSERPDAILVDLGWPRPDEIGANHYILTGGAARPNLQAAAEVLTA